MNRRAVIHPGVRLFPGYVLALSAVLSFAFANVRAADDDEEIQQGDSVTDASAMLEIYETDSALARLLLKGDLDGAALIKELAALQQKDKATLVDCLFARTACQHRAEIKSVEEVSVGLVGDPPEIPGQLTINGPIEGKIRPSPSVYGYFGNRDVGIAWSLELTTAARNPGIRSLTQRAHEPGAWVDRRHQREGASRSPPDPEHVVTLTLDWTVHAGIDSSHVRPGITPKDHPNVQKTHPRFRRVRPEGLVFPLIVGEPVLVTCVPSPRDPDRHAFIFLTTWKLAVVDGKPAH